MENIHQPERQDPEPVGGKSPERLPEKEPEEIASRKRSRASWKSERGYRAEAVHAAPQRGQGFRKDGILDGNHPEKAALKAEHRKTVKGGMDRRLYGGHSARGSRRRLCGNVPEI